MKKTILIAVVTLLIVTLLDCGSNRSSTINGNWSAALMDSSELQVFTFTTSLTESGNGSLNITNFKFTTDSPCFVSDETESGSFGAAGNFSGNVSGQFGMTVQSGSPSGNTLVLSGSANGNTISGTWSLTGGSGCNGSGSFSMNRG